MQLSCKRVIKEKWGEALENDLVKSLNKKRALDLHINAYNSYKL